MASFWFQLIRHGPLDFYIKVNKLVYMNTEETGDMGTSEFEGNFPFFTLHFSETGSTDHQT